MFSVKWTLLKTYYLNYSYLLIYHRTQGRIQDFELGGAHLKKIAPSGGRCENIWGISCEKSYFFLILGARAPAPGTVFDITVPGKKLSLQKHESIC